MTDHYILGLLVILAAINLIAAIRHKYIKKAKAIDEDIANLYESSPLTALAKHMRDWNRNATELS